VSNVDGTQFADLAPTLDPARTLVIVCSKTFTTQETLSNARRVRGWLASALGEAAVPRHFAAVSTNDAAMDAFGIGRDARFAMWDWVGGRYSMWSAVGLSIELAIGTAHFEAMLAGAHAMDEHFRASAWRDNLPALAGVIAHWNRNALGCGSHAVLPYTQRLARLPAYLQQLEMESLGKRTTRSGKPVAAATGAVIWGEPGSNAQHSFFQLLHQGTAEVSADFVLPLVGGADAEADELVIANCLPRSRRSWPGTPRPSRIVSTRAAGPCRCLRSRASTRQRSAHLSPSTSTRCSSSQSSGTSTPSTSGASNWARRSAVRCFRSGNRRRPLS
jgi:glucose-6-phosphate isomerase